MSSRDRLGCSCAGLVVGVQGLVDAAGEASFEAAQGFTFGFSFGA
jgi:hypothetical protein